MGAPDTHLDLVGGLKSVQLVEQLQHGALHLAVAAAAAAVCARAAYAVHLVHEDDAGCMLPAQARAEVSEAELVMISEHTLQHAKVAAARFTRADVAC